MSAVLRRRLFAGSPAVDASVLRMSTRMAAIVRVRWESSLANPVPGRDGGRASIMSVQRLTQTTAGPRG